MVHKLFSFLVDYKVKERKIYPYLPKYVYVLI